MDRRRASRKFGAKPNVLTLPTSTRGTFGAPTFFVGEAMFFGKDRLREVEQEISAQKARGG